MQSTLASCRGLRLRDLLPKARQIGGEALITSCAHDWRQVRPGDLYVALVMPDRDGHDQAQRAIAQGAAAILTERLLPVNVPQTIVPDTREAYGHVCQALAGNPTDELKTIGVTGTNGKTTTGFLLNAVLEAAGCPTGFIGTLGACDGHESRAVSNSTPSSPEIAAWARRSVAQGCTHGVVEATSIGLAQRRLAGVAFDAAVITNIRRDHLDYHGSVLNYRAAKARLLEQLKPGGFVVLNADDPASRFLLERIEAPTLTFALHGEAEITATILERYPSEQTFLLHAGSDTHPVRTRMIGDHHIANCLAAAAVGLTFGIDLPTIIRGLEAVEAIPGRLERLEQGLDFATYVDYARTPDALAMSLKAARRVTQGRLICVFGAAGERVKADRPLLGRVLEKGADVGVITADNPGLESVDEIAHDMLDGYERPAKAHLIPDREKAIHWALGQAQAGDTVLIAGKGNENGQRIGQRQFDFDDRAVARDWLVRRAAATLPPRARFG